MSDVNDPGTPESSQMATIVENLNLQRAILQYLMRSEIVKVVDNAKVTSIEHDYREGNTGWPLVHLSNGMILRTQLLVGRS